MKKESHRVILEGELTYGSANGRQGWYVFDDDGESLIRDNLIMFDAQVVRITIEHVEDPDD